MHDGLGRNFCLGWNVGFGDPHRPNDFCTGQLLVGVHRFELQQETIKRPVLLVGQSFDFDHVGVHLHVVHQVEISNVLCQVVLVVVGIDPPSLFATFWHVKGMHTVCRRGQERNVVVALMVVGIVVVGCVVAVWVVVMDGAKFSVDRVMCP